MDSLNWISESIAPSELVQRIREKLEDIGAFRYILDWEYLVKEASDDFSSDFFGLVNSTPTHNGH